MGRTTVWTLVLVIACLGAIAPMVGCAGSGSKARSAGSDYAELYQAGRYPEALDAARRAERDLPRSAGRERDVATLTAGLAAHAMGDLRTARTELTPLLDNTDARIAGRAGATLGLIAATEGDDEQASALLIGASRNLDGDDAARASIHAGDALTRLGRPDSAQAQYRRASSVATTTSVRRQAVDRVDRGAFAIQLGAFTVRENAEARASEVSPRATALGLGEPMVAEGAAAGGAWMYFVRVGAFATRYEASTAKTRMGLGGVVVAPSDDTR